MMNWQYTPYALPLAVAAVVSAALAVYAWRRRPAPGATPFTLLMLAVAGWSLGYALELGSADLTTKLFWVKVQYIASESLPLTWLVFVLQYTGRRKWLRGRRLTLLAIVPAMTVLLVWTNELHGLIMSNVKLDTNGPFPVLAPSYGVWFWIDEVYAYLLLAAGTLLLIRAFLRSPQPYRGQAGLLLLAALVPWVADALFVAGLSPFPHLDLTPFAFTVTGLVVAWGLFRFRLLDMAPLARDAVIESMNDGVIMLDTQNRIVDLNPAAERIIGHTASGVIGQPAAKVLSPWPRLLQHHGGVSAAQEEIVIGEGEGQRCYDVRISPVHDRHKRLAGRLLVFHDVTEHRRMEEALRDSEARLRLTLEQMPAVFWTTDTQLRFTSSLGAGLAALNLRPNQCVEMTLFEYFQADDPEFLPIAEHRRALEGESTTYEFEWAGNAYQSHVEPLRDAEGHIVGCIGIALDITSRKRAEEALRESEARYQDLYHSAPDLYNSLGPDGTILDINETGARMLGYTREELIGRHVSQILAPEIHDRLRAEFAFTQERREPFEMEVPYRCKDGRTLWCHLRTEWVRDDAGQVLGSRGIARDITERKLAAEALKESHRQYAALVDTVDGIVWEADARTFQFSFVSQQAERLLGYPAESWLAEPTFWQDHIHPDDREWVLEFCVRATAEKQPHEFEYRMVAADGRTVWLRDIVSVVVEDDQPVKLRGVMVDITAHKRAELALRRREAILEAVSFAAERLLETVSWEDSIQAILERLGQATAVSRVYIFENHSDANGTLLTSQRYEWAAPGIEPQIDNPDLQGFPWRAGGFGRWEETLSRGQLIHGHVREFPESEREVLASQDILSIVVVPIFVGQTWWGFIGFDECQADREWSSVEMDALKVAAGTLGAAIQRQQSEEERLARQRYLTLLNDITHAAVEASDFETMLQVLADRMGELLDADGCFITLWDEEQQRAIPAAAYGPLREMYGSVSAEPGELTMTESVLRAGHALVAEDVFNSPHLSPRIAPMFPTRSLLGLPLIADDRKLGAALIAFDEPHQFTPDEIARGEQAARQIALAVAKARLLEATRRRADELHALRETVMDVLAELELPKLLHAVLRRSVTLLNAVGGDLGLYDEATGDILIVVSHNLDKDYAGTRMAPGEGAMGLVAHTREPLIVDDYVTWEGRSPQYAEGPWHGVMAAPLTFRGRLIGAIGIVDSDPARRFSSADLHLLTLFAQQAAIAVENARLFDAVQQRADEAETLREAGAVVAATLQQDEAIQRILEQLQHVVPYDSASVQLLRDGYVEIVGGRGWEDPVPVVGLRFPVPADNPNTVVVQERRPYILDDAPAAHAPFREEPHSHIRSWLGVPLIVADRVIGMLTVDSKQPHHYTAQHARLAAAFADQVAIALENARLFEAARRRAAELEALHQASLSLTSSLELQPVLEAVVHHTLELVAAANVHIFLYDGERLAFGAALWANGPQQTPYAEPRFDGLTYTVARSGERIVIPDVDNNPLFQDWPWGGAIASLPLHVGNQVRGVMNVAFDRPHTFDEEELRVLELLADQAAIALENARLFEAEQRRREVAAALLEVTQVAGSSLELNQILKHITRLTAKVCQTDRCTILLLDEAGESLLPIMSQFADGHVDSEMWQVFKSTSADCVDAVPLFRDAIREHRPIQLDDPARTDLIPRKWTEPFGIQKLLVVPLISHDRVIGIMALDYTDPSRGFTREQIELAQTIGGQVAASIENAQLYAQMQELAITDDLTGLYNRRGFFELGRREIDRARRFGRPLVALMFDLDHFKRVNDARGHAVGDQVLVGLARRCRQELREVDLFGRYGGEEFAVLLPESDLAAGHEVAERLRRVVGQAEMNTNVGLITITVSIGVAALDETCNDLEMLLKRADQALYAAKRAGRNRVSVWQAEA